MKNYIAWEGEKFTIEWYFNSKDESPAKEYFESLSIARKKKLTSLFIIMASRGKIFNEEKFTFEGDQVFAFKPTPDRFLCFFFTGSKIIVTNAYEKKTKKMPPREKTKALKYKDDYLNRVAGGEYYD
jgi:DNA-dependent RNA polymerase auxiliary subunit epsilon